VVPIRQCLNRTLKIPRWQIQIPSREVLTPTSPALPIPAPAWSKRSPPHGNLMPPCWPLSDPAAARPLPLPPAAARPVPLPLVAVRASSPATSRRTRYLPHGAGLAPATSRPTLSLPHGAGRSERRRVSLLSCRTATLSAISSLRRCQGLARRVPIGSGKPDRVRVWWRSVPGGGYGAGWQGLGGGPGAGMGVPNLAPNPAGAIRTCSCSCTEEGDSDT
jgi:hypothetical protein